MFESVTPQQIIDDVEAATDNDGYEMVSDAQFVSWINDELIGLWSWATRCNRNLFTKSVEGQIASGSNYISVTAAAPTGLALIDFLNIRGVDLKLGTDDYHEIRPFNFNTRNRSYTLSYQILAGDQLWLNPKDQAATYPFRMWYITKAPTASSSALSTAMSIPMGGSAYVVAGVAASLRKRLDDGGQDDRSEQEAAKRSMIAWMQTSGGEQRTIADVSDDYFCEIW
jgi:hypothetical protein